MVTRTVVPPLLDSISSWPPMSFTRSCMLGMPTPTPKADLPCDLSRVAPNSYLGLETSGMPLDVGETFLNDAEQSQLDTWLHPSETRRDLQYNLDSSSFGEAFHVMTRRILQPGFVQHRRVQ